MNPLKEFVRELLSDGGKVSSMRFMTVGGMVTFFPAFTLAWLKESLTGGEGLADIPTSVVFLIGTLLAGKAVQKVGEVMKRGTS